MSAGAKQLYNNLSCYAYGDKRWCNPSTEILRFELGWAKSTLNEKLNELYETGMIRVERGGANNRNAYRLLELHKNSIIKHSEIIHRIKPSGARNLEEFHRKFIEYKDTELCEAINKSGSPMKFVVEVVEYFRGVSVEKVEIAEHSPETPNTNWIIEQARKQAQKGQTATEFEKGRVS